MDDSELTTGQRVRRLRKLKDITQLQLAKVLEMTDTAISHMENGKSGLTIENALKISQYYKVSIDWLLKGEGSPDLIGEHPSGNINYSGISQKGKNGNQQVGSGTFNAGQANEDCLTKLLEMTKDRDKWKDKYITLLEKQASK